MKNSVQSMVFIGIMALTLPALGMQSNVSIQPDLTLEDMKTAVTNLPASIQTYQRNFLRALQLIHERRPASLARVRGIEAQVNAHLQNLTLQQNQFLSAGQNLSIEQAYQQYQQMSAIESQLVHMRERLLYALNLLSSPSQKPSANTSTQQPIAIDPIAEIMDNHNFDKSIIEGLVISSTPEVVGEEILNHINTINLATRPATNFANNSATIRQCPSLSQIEIPHNTTLEQLLPQIEFINGSNYCGYYAAHNIWCLLTNHPENILNRNMFAQQFRSMLGRIRNWTQNPEGQHDQPYDNIQNHEIVHLLQQEYGINPDQYVVLSIDGIGIIRPLEPEGLQLLKTFLARTNHELTILLSEGHAGAGHWIVVRVVRTADGKINFTIFDSLGRIDWQEQEKIDNALMPLYTTLTDPALYNEWVPEL